MRAPNELRRRCGYHIGPPAEEGREKNTKRHDRVDYQRTGAAPPKKKKVPVAKKTKDKVVRTLLPLHLARIFRRDAPGPNLNAIIIGGISVAFARPSPLLLAAESPKLLRKKKKKTAGRGGEGFFIKL